jgi:hypothetical protein
MTMALFIRRTKLYQLFIHLISIYLIHGVEEGGESYGTRSSRVVDLVMYSCFEGIFMCRINAFSSTDQRYFTTLTLL